MKYFILMDMRTDVGPEDVQEPVYSTPLEAANNAASPDGFVYEISDSREFRCIGRVDNFLHPNKKGRCTMYFTLSDNVTLRWKDDPTFYSTVDEAAQNATCPGDNVIALPYYTNWDDTWWSDWCVLGEARHWVGREFKMSGIMYSSVFCILQYLGILAQCALSNNFLNVITVSLILLALNYQEIDRFIMVSTSTRKLAEGLSYLSIFVVPFCIGVGVYFLLYYAHVRLS